MSIKRLAGETAIYGISSILGRLLNFVTLTPFLTRVFSDNEYGVISDLFFYTAFGIAFLTFRMDTAVFRFASKPEHDPQQVYRLANRLILGLIAALVGGGLLFAPQIADWMTYSDRVIYIQLVLLKGGLDLFLTVIVCAIPGVVEVTNAVSGQPVKSGLAGHCETIRPPLRLPGIQQTRTALEEEKRWREASGNIA